MPNGIFDPWVCWTTWPGPGQKFFRRRRRRPPKMCKKLFNSFFTNRVENRDLNFLASGFNSGFRCGSF